MGWGGGDNFYIVARSTAGTRIGVEMWGKKHEGFMLTWAVIRLYESSALISNVSLCVRKLQCKKIYTIFCLALTMAVMHTGDKSHPRNASTFTGVVWSAGAGLSLAKDVALKSLVVCH